MSVSVDNMKLDLDNREFQIAMHLIQDANQSFFLTGKAGTGKSTFLKHIVDKKYKNFVVIYCGHSLDIN